MNGRTETALYDNVRLLDPGLSPAQAAFRIRALCHAMEAGATLYERDSFIKIMAVCEVAIANMDAAEHGLAEAREAGLL